MIENRRPLYVGLTADAYDGWQRVAARHKVSITVLLESIGRNVMDQRWSHSDIERHPMVEAILTESRDLRAARLRRAPTSKAT